MLFVVLLCYSVLLCVVVFSCVLLCVSVCCCVLLCVVVSGNALIHRVSAPSEGEHLVFLERFAREHRLGQCLQRVGPPGARPEGSPRAKKHRFDLPCTTFRCLCYSKASCFMVFFSLPMAKTSCFLRGRLAHDAWGSICEGSGA